MDLEQEIQAAKIRVLGQCPKHNGHVSDWAIGSHIFAVMVGAILFATLFSVSTPDYRNEALERGFATLDPVTAEFKWKPRQTTIGGE